MRRLCHPAEGETSSVAAALAAPAVSSLEAWRRRLARSEELQESAQAVETIQASSASVKADAPTTQSMKTGPPPRCAHSSPPVYPGWAAQTHHPTRPTPETYSYAKPATATTSPARKIRLTEQAFRAGRPAARSPIDADGMTVAFKVYEESPQARQTKRKGCLRASKVTKQARWLLSPRARARRARLRPSLPLNVPIAAREDPNQET